MSIGQYFETIFSKVWENIGDIIFNVSWTNTYFVLLIVYITAFLLESFLPAKKPYSVLGRKGFWTDLGYLFFIDFLFGIIGFIALTYTLEFAFTKGMSAMGVTLPLMNPINLPFWAQALLFFVVMDFCQFFAHYLLHHINFFWKFHKIHHAQETLGFASTRHFHIMEYFVLKP
ncbi:MAG: sterol desaturase family protein, partial [Bacteroidia bacterium]